MVKKNSKNNNSTFPVHILLTNFKSSFRFSEEIEMEQWNIGLMILLKLKKINENCGLVIFTGEILYGKLHFCEA